MASLFDLLHGLTKVEVVGPDGNPQFYNPPEQNSKNALAFLGGVRKQNAQAVEPSTDTHDVQLPTESSAAIPPELQAIFNGQPQAQAKPGSESIAQQDNQHPLSFLRPNFKQASSDAVGLPNAKSPALTTKGKTLLTLLQGGLGALAGSDQRTAAGGYRAAVEQPIQRVAQKQSLERGGLENQVLGAQVQMLPWERVAKIAALQKVNAETGKAQAEGQKATAEAGRIPAQKALDEANALKAQFHDVDGVTYHIGKDPSGQPTMTPVDAGAQIPVQSDEIAKVLNVKVGDNVPLSRQLKAADLITKGTSNYTTGEGVFEKNRVSGKMTRLGTAPAIASINLQQGPYLNPIDAKGNVNPKLKASLDDVGNYKMPLSEALSRVPAAGKAGFLQALKQLYPDFDQKTYEAAQKTLDSATSGPLANELSAYNTAILHANLLKQAAKAIAQHNTRALNALENSFQTEFGEAAPLTFDALAHLYTGETTKVVAAGHITDSELGKTGATLGRNNSPKQINGVLDAYANAMKSKRDVRKNQIEKAMKGQVAFEGPNEKSGITVTDPQGGIHTFKTQAEADGFKKLAGIQ